MIRRPPRSTRTDTLFPYTTLFRSHPVAVLKPAVRLERPAGDSVTAPVIGQPRDPEAVRLMRAFDRHAQFFGKDSGRAAMIDMAMGDENLLYRHAMLRGGRLQLFQIAAGIDERALHRSRSDERRGGKECVSKCRSRWSADNLK